MTGGLGGLGLVAAEELVMLGAPGRERQLLMWDHVGYVVEVDDVFKLFAWFLKEKQVDHR